MSSSFNSKQFQRETYFTQHTHAELHGKSLLVFLFCILREILSAIFEITKIGEFTDDARQLNSLFVFVWMVFQM